MPGIRPGMALRYEGELYLVVNYQHIHMGRGGATIRTRLKNLITGQVKEISLRDSDEFEEVSLERKSAHLSYIEGENYHFLESDTFEDITFTRDHLGDAIYYLKEGDEVTVLYADGGPINIELPTYVVLEVVETDPGLRGDTASGGSKPAKLETGLVIQVPLFVKVGDKLKIDTRTGEYIERV
ncbi:MAG TPA: elongation factor P [Candidatus Hydrothermia bacterium]|mgnify:FL=1|nr:elongation factor P [Candidatus Hydrothermae bacterium]MDD3648617.1 elongation factor P [Candidatus Hydrothermia bacterium]MDD5572519.1 elongation factor P [Candidatus Hydrothermia bacterium]HOK22523.1 elongation factor P [Candidatus Hydrothermia bacterium]HOL23230.1 elongation factor P [Candidatus Hydrothermia bacterium]